MSLSKMERKQGGEKSLTPNTFTISALIGGSAKSRTRRGAAQTTKMVQDYITNLPSDITVNILSRLPAPAAVSCKCVCKSFLDLIESREFVKSHLSKTVPGLAVIESGTLIRPYKIFQFVDEIDRNLDVPRWNEVFNFDFPYNVPLHSSVDGLLFLCERRGLNPSLMFLCNPVTREYIQLPSAFESSTTAQRHIYTCGFGVSRMSGQYKVVRIFREFHMETHHLVIHRPEFQVYTLGTGTWRTIASSGPCTYRDNTIGVFLNDNLHWLVEVQSSLQVSCFDLETELISTFPVVPLLVGENFWNLSALENSLCLCENSGDGQITMWLMKEYGDEKSWRKEFVIRSVHLERYKGLLWPVKVFRDGDILIELETDPTRFYYSNKTKTVREVYLPQLVSRIHYKLAIYTPSFVPLNTFAAIENVSSFPYSDDDDDELMMMTMMDDQ